MSLRESLDVSLQRAVSTGDVPGVAAAVTNRDGSLYEGGFGERVLGGGEAMTPDTVLWIASMTKAITGLAAMQLVEQGSLALDSPASTVIPYLGDVEVLVDFDDDGQPRTRPPRRPITLRHLLTHTAGFGYDIWSQAILRYREAKGVPDVTSGENAALTTPLLFDPGERWDYGIGIDWVGKLVEAVSGQRLGSYMKDHIFDPLGMTSTAFRLTSDMRSRLAKIHQRGDDGDLTPIDLEIQQDPEFEAGGHGLYSTVGDYLRFVRAILNQGRCDGGALVQPATVASMSRNQMGECRVGAMETTIPHLSNDVDLFPGMSKTWGLTFMINEEPAPTGRAAGSLSWAGLANCYFWIDPTTGIGGVYATQILPFADTKALPLYYEFETTVYQQIH